MVKKNIHGISKHHEQLVYLENGDLAPVTFNIYLILRYHDDWKGVLGCSAKNKVQALKEPPYSSGFIGPWTDTDNVLTACWLQQHCALMVTPAQVGETVQAVAESVDMSIGEEHTL